MGYMTGEIADAAYAEYKKAGHGGIMQPFIFADTEEGHVEILLKAASFPSGGMIIDAGCGTGRIAEIMKAIRPDLNFVLVNFSLLQLSDAPDCFYKILCDACDMPVRDSSVDGVMFNASLCNMDNMKAIKEAVRVLKPGGVLFVNDLARIDGDNEALSNALLCRAFDPDGFIKEVSELGMQSSWYLSPAATCYHLKEIWQDDEAYEVAFRGVVPGLWRFVKQ